MASAMTRLARRPVRLFRVFHVYNKVVDEGGVVIDKQDFSIVDKREPVIAMPLHPRAIFQDQSDICHIKSVSCQQSLRSVV